MTSEEANPKYFTSPLGVSLASLGSRAAGVPSSLRSDRSAPLRPLTRFTGAANLRTIIAQNEPYHSPAL
jgi:hypothetical protein